MGLELKSRRAVYVDIVEEMKKGGPPVSSDQVFPGDLCIPGDATSIGDYSEFDKPGDLN
jgi:hypothetical protein